MARRLPVYLLLDTSGSMSGKPIEAVQNGLATLRSALNNEPQALETVHLSIITFDDTARQVIPLTELSQFKIPQLKVKAGSGAALGVALRLVSECAEREVIETTPETKGDWKPLVFLMTDSHVTDDISEGITAFKKKKWDVVVACSASTNANENILKSITENVFRLDTASSEEFKSLFKWDDSTCDDFSLDDPATTSGEILEPPPEEIEVFPQLDPDSADTLPLGDPVGSAPESSSSSSSPAEDAESAGENQGTSSEDAMEDLLLPPEITLL